MGGSSSTTVSKSLFKTEELETLRVTFQSLDSPLFSIPTHPDFDSKVKSYIQKYMKSRKDFCSFVGVLEYIVYGKSINIDVLNSSSLLILIQILSPCAELQAILPDLLISMVSAPQSLLAYISLTSSDPKRICDYFEHHFPLLGSSFSRFVKSRIFKTSLSGPPSVPIEGRVISQVLPLLYYSTYNLQNSSSELHPLFLSDQDGFSFTKLVQAITGYMGSMILVLKLDGDRLIGAHIGEDIRDNANFSGSMDTFLYSLVSGFKTFKPEYGNMQGQYIYLNSKISKSAKFPKGLGFGGDKSSARLWLDFDLDRGSYVSDSCGTFETGKLVETAGHEVAITIVNIEIWGCGGEKALQAQQKIKKSDEIRATNARKVDRTELANNAFNREHLLGGTFKNSQYKSND